MADFDPYYKWLGIPPVEQPPDHYRLLGLRRFEPDPEVIEAAADRIATFLQTVATGQYVAESQQLLNQVTAARRCLLKVDSRVAYDRQLRARQPEVAPPPAPPQSVPAASVTRPPPSAQQPHRTHRAAASAPRRVSPWLVAAAGGALMLLVAVAAVAWSLRGSSPSQRTAAKPRDAATSTKATSAGQSVPPATSPPASAPLATYVPTSPQRESALAAQEPDVYGWRATRPSASLRVEKGALALEETGAVNREVPLVPGPFLIELKAGGSGAGKIRVQWTVVGQPEFAPERSIELELAPDSQWQELSAALPVAGTLTGLRIDPPSGQLRLELDSVHLHEPNGKKGREWGFGAAAPKRRKLP